MDLGTRLKMRAPRGLVVRPIFPSADSYPFHPNVPAREGLRRGRRNVSGEPRDPGQAAVQEYQGQAVALVAGGLGVGPEGPPLAGARGAAPAGGGGSPRGPGPGPRRVTGAPLAAAR